MFPLLLSSRREERDLHRVGTKGRFSAPAVNFHESRTLSGGYKLDVNGANTIKAIAHRQQPMCDSPLFEESFDNVWVCCIFFLNVLSNADFGISVQRHSKGRNNLCSKIRGGGGRQR
ncbi:UNVERIFIED_CONTAM: hypothetical protein K2H54_001721 [Gekko kuhli]